MADAPFKSYSDALDFLSEFTNYEKRSRRRLTGSPLGLERISALLDAAGRPQDGLRCIHIAGTKGKGSTGAMISRILRCTGARVGLYSSPHVLSERERIQVDGKWITEERATSLLGRMYPYLAEAMSNSEAYRPSFFEIITALAFLHFVEERTDWAVMEVGLGGRLDATNVVSPEVCVITPVSFDHTDLLGETLAEIAREKAGIIKPGVPVVISQQQPEALEAICDRAAELDAPVRCVGTDIRLNSEPNGGFTVATRRRHYDNLRCAMPGVHQQQNAATAIGAIEVLNDAGHLDADDNAVSEGLAAARLPGRVEVLPGHPIGILDVAHNAASLKALFDVIDDEFEHERMFVVFGCSIDKDARGMLGMLAPRVHRMFVVGIDNPRGTPAAELGRLARAAGCRSVDVAPGVEQAVAAARQAAGPRDLICMTGSFYLAGDASRAWRKYNDIEFESRASSA